MKKKRVSAGFISILLAAVLLVITGCGSGNDGSNGDTGKKNTKNSNGPQIGDYVSYAEFLNEKEYSTDSSLTGNPTEQTFKTNTDLTWVVMANENGKITLVADQNTLSTEERGLGLNNQEGYLNGVKVLDDLCNTLYASDYGTSRSIKANDIRNLITNEKSKKNKANSNELEFTSGTFYDGKEFREAAESNPIKVKSDYENYSFYKELELDEILAKDISGYRPESIYENYRQFWVSDSGVEVCIDKDRPNLNYVSYGISYSLGYTIGVNAFLICDARETLVQRTFYLGVRPVIELNADLQFTKTDTGDGIRTWTITE